MDLAKPDRTLDESCFPTLAEQNQIKPGDYCRLQTRGGSRFWCRVVGIKPNGSIHGLTEDSLKDIGMQRGQLVVFGKVNVYEIL